MTARPAPSSPGTPRSRVRVLVAARQPLLREAVARAVRQRVDLQLVAEVPDGPAALEAIERAAPDVAVVDSRLPRLDGGRVVRAVVRDGLDTRVLLLGAGGDSDGAYDALAAGAAGWLSAATHERELCGAIVAVARGGIAVSPDAQTALAAAIRRRASGDEPLLDARERRMLALVAQGRSASEIAAEMHVATGVVRSRLPRLYQRLGVSDRAAAVAVAIRRGLID
jgi:two-component system nitrate/nitrite response regulator NarL